MPPELPPARVYYVSDDDITLFGPSDDLYVLHAEFRL
jgi:hypothetical protein